MFSSISNLLVTSKNSAHPQVILCLDCFLQQPLQQQPCKLTDAEDPTGGCAPAGRHEHEVDVERRGVAVGEELVPQRVEAAPDAHDAAVPADPEPAELDGAQRSVVHRDSAGKHQVGSDINGPAGYRLNPLSTFEKKPT